MVRLDEGLAKLGPHRFEDVLRNNAAAMPGGSWLVELADATLEPLGPLRACRRLHARGRIRLGLKGP